MLARGEAGAFPEGVETFVADRQSGGAYDDAASENWDAVIDVTRHPGLRGARSRPRRARRALGVRVVVLGVRRHADAGRRRDGRTVACRWRQTCSRTWTTTARPRSRERAVLEGVGPERSLIARPSLIGGPADWSGRGGYWPLRFAHPAVPGRVLVPDAGTPGAAARRARPRGTAHRIRCRPHQRHHERGWTDDAAHRAPVDRARPSPATAASWCSAAPGG